MEMTHNEFTQKIQNRTPFEIYDYDFEKGDRKGHIFYQFKLPELNNIEILVETAIEVDGTHIELGGDFDNNGGSADESIARLEDSLTVLDADGDEIDSNDLFRDIIEYIHDVEFPIPKAVIKAAGGEFDTDNDRYELIGDVDDKLKFPSNPEDVSYSEFKLFRDEEEDTFVCQADQYHGGLVQRRQEECDTEKEIFEFFKKYDCDDLWRTKALFRDADMMTYDEYGIDDDTPEEDIKTFEIDGQLNDVKIAGTEVDSYTSYEPFGGNEHIFRADIYQTGGEEFVVIKYFSNCLNFPYDEYAVEVEDDLSMAVMEAEMFVDAEEPLFKGQSRKVKPEDMDEDFCEVPGLR